MKNHLTLLSLLLLSFIAPYRSFAQISGAPEDRGIHFFHGTWEEAQAEAKKTHKPIFVDAYASWCGPCRYMAANVFTDGEVGDFYNQNFVNYKFDMEKSAGGPDFAKQYRVEAYPTLFYFDDNLTLKNRVLGGQDKNGLLREGKNAVTKMK